MLDDNTDKTCEKEYNWIQPRDKDLRVQTALSLILGISALVTFCVSVTTSSCRRGIMLANPLGWIDFAPTMAETLRRTQAEAGPEA